jgi:hypothetical protein
MHYLNIYLTKGEICHWIQCKLTELEAENIEFNSSYRVHAIEYLREKHQELYKERYDMYMYALVRHEKQINLFNIQNWHEMNLSKFVYTGQPLWTK